MNYYKIYPIDLHPYITEQFGKLVTDLEIFKDQLYYIINDSFQLNLTPYVLLADIHEGRIYDKNIKSRFEDVLKIVESLKIEFIFILDGEFENYSQIEKTDKIIYSDYLPLVTYVHGILAEDQKINDNWNANSPLGLWTPGKLERSNRIVLISKLWEKNLINKLKLSFYPCEDVLHTLKEMVNFDDIKFDKFINECKNALDFEVPVERNFIFNGFPFDHSLYSTTSFSIISESDFYGSDVDNNIKPMPKITEKTYRTIINKHPFICAWNPGMIEKLKEKGYKTFEEYWDDPNYNSYQDIEQRHNAIIQNIETCHLRLIENEEKIRNDVEHNLNNYLEVVQKELKKLEPVLNIPQHFNKKISITRLVTYFNERNFEYFKHYPKVHYDI